MEGPGRRGAIIGLLLMLYMVGSGAVDFALHSPLLGIITESFWPAIALVAWPILRPREPTAALLFVVLGSLILVVGILENAGIATMVAHLVVRMLHGAAMAVLYAALFRMRAVPRLLAGAGVLASLLQIGALATPFFGREVYFPLLAPTGLCQLVLSLWLIARGIDRTTV